MKDYHTTAASTLLSPEELVRYSRQVLVPEVGEEGQKKLKEAKVFVAGFGGLGSISCSYLVAAGVGEVRVVDRDRVELSNLNRQIAHWTTDLGIAKAESGSGKLRRLNPLSSIVALEEEMVADNLARLVGESHILVDATDNIETRRRLNRFAVERSLPFVLGGVKGFQGMVTTFVPGETPCFECIFGHLEAAPDKVGVLGPVPGVIACLQVLEVIKLIIGLGGLLKGRLLLFNGLDMNFREIAVERNPECLCCGSSRER